MFHEDSTKTAWSPPASLYGIVFALNLVSSAAYALPACILRRFRGDAPFGDLCYWFLRGSVRINDVLHIGSVAPVSISAVARQWPTHAEQVGKELVLLGSVFAATTLVCLVLKPMTGTRVHHVITHRFLSVSLLFAAPLSYLFAMYDSSGVPSGASWIRWPGSFWWLVLLLAAEAIGAIIVLPAARMRRVSSPVLGALLVLHYGLWVPVLWLSLPGQDFGLLVGFFAPRVLLAGFPVLGILWFLLLRRGESSNLEAGAQGAPWSLVMGAVALAALGFVWLPHPVRSLADPQHLDSVTVQLWRGPCYGMCPAYSFRVQGSGVVEYAGGEFVNVRGKATATLDTEQVTKILQKLETVCFFGIEDRAFAGGFDTPTTAVSVSIDGHTHLVTSDAVFTGAKSGTQARFVQVAREIDQIVGAKRWVE